MLRQALVLQVDPPGPEKWLIAVLLLQLINQTEESGKNTLSRREKKNDDAPRRPRFDKSTASHLARKRPSSATRLQMYLYLSSKPEIY